MNKSVLFFAATALMVGCATADKQAPKNTINQEEVITKMSLEDKAHFVIGTGMAGFSGDDAVIGATRNLVPGAAGTTYPLDSLGIPSIVCDLLLHPLPHRHPAGLYLEHQTHRGGWSGHWRRGEGVWH